jgi:hypothetical protein
MPWLGRKAASRGPASRITVVASFGSALELGAFVSIVNISL